MTFHPPLSVQSPTTRQTKSKGKAAIGPRHAELSRMQTALHQSPAVRRLQVLQRITINMDPGDNAIAPAAMISLAREKSGTLTASPPNPDAGNTSAIRQTNPSRFQPSGKANRSTLYRTVFPRSVARLRWSAD